MPGKSWRCFPGGNDPDQGLQDFLPQKQLPPPWADQDPQEGKAGWIFKNRKVLPLHRPSPPQTDRKSLKQRIWAHSYRYMLHFPKLKPTYFFSFPDLSCILQTQEKIVHYASLSAGSSRHQFRHKLRQPRQAVKSLIVILFHAKPDTIAHLQKICQIGQIDVAASLAICSETFSR